MRRMASRSALWVVAVSFAAATIALAQNPSARRPRVEMPERLGPPIVVTPPNVKMAPAPDSAELGNAKPARPVPGSVSIVLPPDTHWCWLLPAPHPVLIPAAGSKP
jgi:hypothetical protein